MNDDYKEEFTGRLQLLESASKIKKIEKGII